MERYLRRKRLGGVLDEMGLRALIALGTVMWFVWLWGLGMPALLAGLAVGVYASMEDTAAVWQRDLTFEPQMEEHHRTQLLHGWHKAVERSLAWAKE